MGELLHPLPLLAVMVMAANDHWLKGSGLLPGWLTGKISDAAGVCFFPLLLTAGADTLLFGLARTFSLAIDFSLRRWKLGLAIAVTAGIFVALELSAAWAKIYVDGLGQLGLQAQTTRDPSDLLALVMLLPAWWLGLAEIRRIPLGRLEVVARTGGERNGFDDVRQLHPFPQAVEELAARYADWIQTRTEDTARVACESLDRLRATADGGNRKSLR